MDMIREKTKGKRILIWGYGREGKSTEKLLKEACEPASVEVYEGDRSGVQDEKYDLIFVSPGIPFEEVNPKFTSQTELFMEEYGAQTVGITGTKGKSTTSAMLHKVLTDCGKKSFLMGNIGLPCFDYVSQMSKDSIAVFELSCHQCQRLLADPHIAVFLDLYEDHLDRYHTMAHYFDAKLGITKSQTADDIIYYGQDVPSFTTKAQKVLVTRDAITPVTLRIPGDHNHYNAEFVRRIARDQFGCSDADISASLATFGGLPHRLEFCGNIRGIDWYDDSISTIPEASIRAMEAVHNAATLLLGGMDRGIDYDVLVAYMKKHPEITFILAYASGKRVYEEAKGDTLPNVYLTEDLTSAVQLAAEKTPKGKAAVLSPAAASYGYFKNFEERGDFFKQCIAKR